MATRYITKSDNFWAAVSAGGTTQWIHIDAGKTGRTTIKKTSKANSGLILCNVVVNTGGSSGVVTFTDSKAGVIAQYKSGVGEKDYHYNIPLQGDLLIDNSAGSDMTIIYVTP